MAAVMKYDGQLGKESPLVTFSARDASRRKKPDELPPAPYFV
jgi:hypothetical protein